ncbi:aerobic glycerol-3-phosphate dehydrogenase [Patiriisocius marinistellae]|uniref:Glycerol-3-phosphate dehydrogenase n=2 Tax=Patiriisocius marinistellae TaxID=2494560 RepID=A0A5J4FXK8_9FLAO|nr:aerobic glycerol-3-phosphate dehydrogenase [Patiriisocius marinistellae]
MEAIHTFSVLNRVAQLQKIETVPYDLVIIGGGVTGAGIALDAASRGLKTCLVEKNDFASGTSNKSTKLIHGGLRYLKQLEIGLVKESGRERAIVHKLAPHLVIPEKMLLPLTKNGTYGALLTSIGLKVYDLLANVEGDDRRKMLDKNETLALEPLLSENTLLGGGYYSEYRTDDARLTIELLKTASSYGATIINYAEMTGFQYSTKNKVNGIICIDHNTDETFEIKAKRLVSATGPWVDLLRKKDGSLDKKHLYLTKGVHLVFPFQKLPVKQSIYFDAPDGRMLFAIPRGRITYVGTTDTPYNNSLERVVTTKNDVAYVIKAINETFKTSTVTEKDIESTWAGLRPLIHEKSTSPSEVSRKDEIFVSERGLISIAGGKLTGYRKMAQRVIEKVLDTMKQKYKVDLKKSTTKNISLTIPAFKTAAEVAIYKSEINQRIKSLGVFDEFEVDYLIATYGKQTELIIEKSLKFQNTNLKEKFIRAELWFCITYEMVNSLTDFFVRRTGRLYFNIDSVIAFKSIILEDCIQILKWDEQRVDKEITELNVLIKDATTFYEEEIKTQ